MCRLIMQVTGAIFFSQNASEGSFVLSEAIRRTRLLSLLKSRNGKGDKATRERESCASKF